MNKFEYNKLTPFKWFVLENFPFIEADFDALTEWQLFCKIGKEINKIINSQNIVGTEMEKISQAFIELQNYVNNYFANLDVQDEINTKLNEMVEDGTFEQLINVDILNNKLNCYTINTEFTIEKIQELLNINKPKIINFEKGTYNFNHSLQLNKNTILNLNNSILNFSVNYAMYNFLNTDEFLKYDGNSNIKIINGTIKGGSIAFCHASNIEFTNVNFENCNNGHIIELMAINNCIINSCSFKGVILQSSDRNYVEMIQLDDSLYINFPYFEEENPTFDNTTNKNITIKNSYFGKSLNTNYSFYTAFGMHSSNGNLMHENITFENNILENMENCGLNLLNCKNVKIGNNTFKKDTYETTSLGGAMIRVRQYNEDYYIYDNVFDGNISALQQFGSPLLNNNFNFYRNLLQNYNNDTNTPIIHISNSNIKIENNTFKNFGKNCIRLNPVENLNDKEVVIRNNIFKTNTDFNDQVIKCYSGKLMIDYNNFDINLSSNKLIQFSETYDDIISFSKNIFKYIEKDMLIGGANYIHDFNNLYDKKFVAFNGNSTSLTNQNIKIQGKNVNFTEFNRAELVLGGGNYTQQFILRPWDIYKLTPRTFKYPIFDGSQISTFTFTINNDNTFNYSSELPLRSVILYNE